MRKYIPDPADMLPYTADRREYGFPYRLFWGDLHVHSVLGKCGTPHLPKQPDFGYWYARDIFGHDFCSITDHASKLDEESFEQVKSSAERWHTPGKFVTLLGFEGDYDGEDGGHFTLPGMMRISQRKAVIIFALPNLTETRPGRVLSGSALDETRGTRTVPVYDYCNEPGMKRDIQVSFTFWYNKQQNISKI
jgi:hypothetical protein